MLKEKLTNGEHFAFGRFSDGELFMMKNLELILGDGYYQIGNQRAAGHYVPENYKHFIPGEHEWLRQKLMDAYQFKKENYYVGLSCRCCVGQADFDLMIEWRGGDDDHLTWANLWVNGNYPLFKQHIVPELSNHKVVFILNENANIEGLPFPLVKDFRVGPNCFINDIDVIDRIKDWIEGNQIKDHVFLFSASALSEVAIYELFKDHDQNTYIDVGTTLSPYFGVDGAHRDYLIGGNSLRKICIW